MESIVWLIVGLIAGWLGGLVMKGSGYAWSVAIVSAAVFVGAARLLTRRTVRA